MKKVIIKISDEVYENIKKRSNEIQIDGDSLENAVLNGTLLDDVKERIELEKLGYPPSAEYYKAIMKVLQILE
jgi:hypothetical protein